MKDTIWVTFIEKIGLRQELFGAEQPNSLEQANAKEESEGKE